MKKINYTRQLAHFIIVFLLISILQPVAGQTDTVLIDFGPVSGKTDLPWNNFSDTEVTAEQSLLFNSDYKATPFKIELTDRFAGFNTQGVDITDAAIGFPSEATIDSYYGNTVDFYGALEPTGGLKLSGLDATKTYTIIFYGGRASTENREAKYTLVGLTTVTGSLNPANNTTNVLELSVAPKADGTIDINVAPGDTNASGYKFYYLNAIKIVYEEISYIQPTITITTPNGGEKYASETTQSITWTGENLTEDIIVSYSDDNGNNWINLDTVANTVTSIDWTIPVIPSTNYLAKVTSFVAEDMSDANFEVEGELPKLDTVLIDFGSPAILSDLPWNNHTSMTESDIISPLYDSQLKATPFRIRVSDSFSSYNDGGITNPDTQIKFPSTATSDSYYGNTVDFYGALEPSGGLQLYGFDPAKSYTFIFYAGRASTDNRETEYTLIGSTTVSGVLNPSSNTSNTLELIVTPKADGTIDLNVTPGANNNNAYKFYYLNAIKIIYDDIDYPQPEITVTAPNGGEQYASETSQTISWTGTNLNEDVIISYSNNNGSTWMNIDTVETSVSSIDWEIPLNPSANYLVKVKSFIAEDVSDATFEVIGELPELDTIMIDFGNQANESAAPWNNLKDWNVGSGITKLRNSNNLQTAINIDIIDRFTGINETGTAAPQAGLLMPATATSDSYYGNTVDFGGIEPTGGFSISGLNPDETYTFEVFGSRMSVSDVRETKYVFTGTKADSVYLNTSNNEVNNATISLSPDAEGKVKLIVSAGENNTNGYKFYYIGALKLIYDKADPLPASLEVVTPNGSENWSVGSVQEISWENINISDDIDISYSSDNGTNWTAIETVIASTNSVSWTVPDAISTECLIKLSSGVIEDQSDAIFSISSPEDPSVNLTQPNGDEKWLKGTFQNISWTSNLLSDDIIASYSSDNGTTWTEIETVSAEKTNINWQVPEILSEECLVKLESGNYSDISASPFSITDPLCSNTIVVLGSSTSAGAGASTQDSAWVWRYAAALTALNSDYEVVNLGVGGYTTFQIVPNGTVFEEGISETIDKQKNVTKAITYAPYAIIVNMPSNDAYNYSAEQTLANLQLVYDYAGARGIQTWIATTQPRNFTDQAKIDIQQYLATEIPSIYKENSLDFWTDIADDNGLVSTIYDYGDGVHLNNAGHKLLFERVMAKGIHLNSCDPPNAIQTKTQDQVNLKVYPNPARDHFTLCFSTNSVSTVEISFMDISGRKIETSKKEVYQPGEHELTFSCEELAINKSMLIGILKITTDNQYKESFVKIVVE